MAEKIVIAQLDIDTKALVQQSVKLKKELEQLKESQKQLQKEGKANSQQFIENAANIKQLSSAYNQNIKSVIDNAKATNQQANATELITQALSMEVTTIAEARAQNKLLNDLRNNTNATTAEGVEQIQRLNNALDANNEFIKENADAYLKQKINIGNYSESIKEAFNDLNIFNGGLTGFVQRSQEAGGAGNLFKESLSGAASGLAGLTKASLAFIATPIGAILAALVAAFALIQNALRRNEESTNKLRVAFSSITGIFQRVLQVLEPLGEFLIDGLVMGFEAVLAVAEKVRLALADFADFLGFEDAADGIRELNDEINAAAAAGRQLAEAEIALEKAQRQARITQLQFQKDAEKLRQIRDDESKSIAERVKANEDLGKVLEQQLNEELAIAQQALIVANLRIEAEGRTKEALDAQAEALTNIVDIEERITGQLSEQLANLNSLRRDAAAQAKEIADKAIADQEAQLQLFIQQQGVRARTLQEQLAIDEQVAEKRIEILRAELQNRNITQTEFDAQLLQIQNELLQARAQTVTDEAQRELNAYIEANQSKIDSDLFFSDESLRIEQERLNGIAEQRREFAQTQLAQGVINQQEFNDAINQINEENRLALEEAQAERDEAQKEKDLIDLENKRIAEEERTENQFALEADRLERQRLLEVEAAEKTGADVNLINQKYAKFREDLEAQVQELKVAQQQQAFNDISNLIGQESKLGKAIAIANIVNSTIQESTKAFQLAATLAANPLTAPLAANATFQGFKIIATGAANVARTTGIKLEDGGIVGVGGKRHSQGGTKFYGEDGTTFEAERGEGIGVLNRSAFDTFMNFNNAFGSGQSRAGFFEGGGIISRAIPSPQDSNRELLQALQNLPAPIVTVEDIRRESNSFVQVENIANV